MRTAVSEHTIALLGVTTTMPKSGHMHEGRVERRKVAAFVASGCVINIAQAAAKALHT